MTMRLRIPTVAICVSLAGHAMGQPYPIMDRVADKVIQKYQASTCEQLWQNKAKPKSPMDQRVVQALRGDPGMRQAFFDKVAGPITNKMFECGIIP